MMKEILRLFKSIKPEVFSTKYKTLISIYTKTKEICTKDITSVSCSHAVDKLEEFVKNYKKDKK